MSCTPLHVRWYWDNTNESPYVEISSDGRVFNPPWIVSLWYGNFWAGNRLVNNQDMHILLTLDAGREFLLNEYRGFLGAFTYNFTIPGKGSADMVDYLCEHKVSEATLKLLVSPEFFPCSYSSTEVRGGERFAVYTKRVKLMVDCSKVPKREEHVVFKVLSVKQIPGKAAIEITASSSRPWPLLILSGGVVCCAGTVHGTQKILWNVSRGNVCVFPRNPSDPFMKYKGQCKYYKLVSKYYPEAWMSKSEWVI